VNLSLETSPSYLGGMIVHIEEALARPGERPKSYAHPPFSIAGPDLRTSGTKEKETSIEKCCPTPDSYFVWGGGGGGLRLSTLGLREGERYLEEVEL